MLHNLSVLPQVIAPVNTLATQIMAGAGEDLTYAITHSLVLGKEIMKEAEFLFNPLSADATIFTYLISGGIGVMFSFWIIRKVINLGTAFFRSRRSSV